jgi:hypothetical protein
MDYRCIRTCLFQDRIYTESNVRIDSFPSDLKVPNHFKPIEEQSIIEKKHRGRPFKLATN